MAELKAVTVIGVIQDIFETPYGEFYFRKEADAVIRHHKYKRCVAMAQMCYTEQIERFSVLHPNEFGYLLMKKWRTKWLELAEHFKPEAR